MNRKCKNREYKYSREYKLKRKRDKIINRKYKACKGCRICYGTMGPHYKNKDGTIEECPCVKCFIKRTCSIPCKEYNDYYARNI